MTWGELELHIKNMPAELKNTKAYWGHDFLDGLNEITGTTLVEIDKLDEDEKEQWEEEDLGDKNIAFIN